MAIPTQGFAVEQLSPADLLNQPQQQQPFDFNSIFQLLQIMEMRQAGDVVASGGADKDSSILNALRGPTARGRGFSGGLTPGQTQIT